MHSVAEWVGVGGCGCGMFADVSVSAEGRGKDRWERQRPEEGPAKNVERLAMKGKRG